MPHFYTSPDDFVAAAASRGGRGRGRRAPTAVMVIEIDPRDGAGRAESRPAMDVVREIVRNTSSGRRPVG